MKFAKYLICTLLLFLSQCLLGTENSNISKAKTSELKSYLFCQYVKIILSQDRRTYFGNNDNFFLEEKIKIAWNKCVNQFVLTRRVCNIRFMIIQFGGFVSPKNFSYIITDDIIYRLNFNIGFESNPEKSVQISQLRVNEANKDEIFENILNLRKNYFIMNNRLWIIGDNPRVFCIFSEMMNENKLKENNTIIYPKNSLDTSVATPAFVGCYSIRYPETVLDKFILKIDNMFDSSKNIAF